MPTPDSRTRRYDLSPDQLYALVRTTVTARPRTTELSADLAHRRADFVERSLVFRFPDTISVQVLPDGDGSGLVLYSRSQVGRYDFGVNKRRVSAILSSLDETSAR